MPYFKSANNYNNFRYYTCENYNKKSKKNGEMKMCDGKIKVNLVDNSADHINGYLKEHMKIYIRMKI